MDLTMFNFTPLEDGTRRAIVLNGDWKGEAVSHPTRMMECDCDSSWGGVGQCWKEEQSALQHRLVPFVKDHMRQTEI